MSEFLIAIIIGIIEGVTEFLPVSSTGHMILAGAVLDFNGSKAATFMIFIQLGAILSVVVLYWDRFIGLLKNNGGGFSGPKGIFKLGLACLPALMAGAVLHKYIKTHLFTPLTVAAGLIIGGIVMVFIERFNLLRKVSSIDDITPLQALKIGLFQTLSLWPGISRSGSTIIGGMLCGLERKAAAEFSFLVAVPIMIAATGYDLLKSLNSLSVDDVPLFATGFLTAFVSAMLAVKLFVSFVSKHTMAGFGIYRIIVGVLTILFITEVAG
jgi:undecaprenyl-diphosphatase